MLAHTNIKLSPEESLALLCCSLNTEPQQLSTIDALLLNPLDWKYLVYIAQQHNIAPLIFHAFDQCKNKSSIPSHILDQLKNAYHVTAFKNLIFLREYNTILKIFNAEHIKTIPLKGIAHLKQLYSNIALRSLADIDILIPQADLATAQTHMTHLGYKIQPCVFFLKDRHFHSVFYKKVKNIIMTVEIHWDLDIKYSTYKIDINDFWERADYVKINDHAYYHLCLEDTILADSFHLLRDTNTIPLIKNLCDLSGIIKKYSTSIDWALILQRAEKYHITRPVLLVWLLLKELFNDPITYNVAERIKQEGFQENMLSLLLTERIFKKPIESFSLPAVLFLKPSYEELSLGIRPLTALKAIYRRARVIYDTNESLISILKAIFLMLKESLLNYTKIVYLYLVDHKNVQMALKTRLRIEEELKNINNWIRNTL